MGRVDERCISTASILKCCRKRWNGQRHDPNGIDIFPNETIKACGRAKYIELEIWFPLTEVSGGYNQVMPPE